MVRLRPFGLGFIRLSLRGLSMVGLGPFGLGFIRLSLRGLSLSAWALSA